MPLGVAIALGAGTALAGAYASHEAGKAYTQSAETAARIEAEQAQKALDFAKSQYADIRPYLMQSMQGYQELLQKPESYKETPGYMFRLQEGLKALGIPEGARNISGAQMKAAIRYGQDYATSEYSNALARIAGLGNIAQGVGATGAQYSNQIGGYLTQIGAAQAGGVRAAGEARASSIMGTYKALTSGIGTGMGYYGMMGQPLSSGTPMPSSYSPGLPGTVSAGNYGPYRSPGYVPPGGSFY